MMISVLHESKFQWFNSSSMKAVISLFCILYFSVIGFSQEDSLKLILSYELGKTPRKYPLNIRVNFNSNKIAPISFDVKTHGSAWCDRDRISLQEEVLVDGSYKAKNKPDCDSLEKKMSKVVTRELQNGDTYSFTGYIPQLDKQNFIKDPNSITANFRFRFSIFYFENGIRKQIFSNWLYVIILKEYFSESPNNTILKVISTNEGQVPAIIMYSSDY